MSDWEHKKQSLKLPKSGSSAEYGIEAAAPGGSALQEGLADLLPTAGDGAAMGQKLWGRTRRAELGWRCVENNSSPSYYKSWT